MPDWIQIDWSRIDWKWAGTFALALYGASLATYREIASRLSKRPNINVSFSASYMLVEGRVQTPQIRVDVSNYGESDATFNQTCVSLQVKGHPTFFLLWQPLVEVKFPYTLKPGVSFMLMNPKDKLTENLKNNKLSGVKKVRAIAVDQLNRRFYSPWLKYDTDKAD